MLVFKAIDSSGEITNFKQRITIAWNVLIIFYTQVKINNLTLFRLALYKKIYIICEHYPDTLWSLY